MKYLSFLCAALLLSACVTTQTSSTREPSPVGQWDYSITGTPQGDFSGVMTVEEVNQALTTKLSSNGSDLPIEKFVYDKATKKMSGEFDYSGTPVQMDAVMEGDLITGTMSAGGMAFPFKATRKK